MKPRHKRLAVIVVGVVGLTVASLFVLNAFRSNLVYFYSPSETLAGKAPINRAFRLGGMVEKGSVQRSSDGLTVDFVVTDLKQKLPVHYQGVLPDLFREGQGVVTQGRLVNGRFMADQVLAKHDEKYMPPEAAKALAGGSYVPGKEPSK
ncbi:MAG: cytochrome c maturation protein CcmE [Gammaproteobacteria bacterium]|nr:cytochrome c maturation protein CcmE [Gammaproteobacteria bacterium]